VRLLRIAQHPGVFDDPELPTDPAVRPRGEDRPLEEIKRSVLARVEEFKERREPTGPLLLNAGRRPDPAQALQFGESLGPGVRPEPTAGEGAVQSVEAKLVGLLEALDLPFAAISEGVGAIGSPDPKLISRSDQLSSLFPTEEGTPLLNLSAGREGGRQVLKQLGTGISADPREGRGLQDDNDSVRLIVDWVKGEGDLSAAELAGSLRQNLRDRPGAEGLMMRVLPEVVLALAIAPQALVRLGGTAGRLGLRMLTSSTYRSRTLLAESRGVLTAEQGGALFGRNLPKATEGSKLSRVEAMWQKSAEGTRRDWPDTLLKIQEDYDDMYIGLRQMQSRVGPVAPGGEKDVVKFLTRAPGAASAGDTRYMLTMGEIKKVSPTAIMDDVDSFIFAQHGREVFAAKGPKRVLGEFKSADEMDEILRDLTVKLGDEGAAEVERAAKVVQRIYNEERQRFVDVGIFSQEFADDMAKQYPWYNPIHYVEFADTQLARGKSVKPFSVVNTGVLRLSETGSAGAVLRPLEVLRDTLIRNEVRLHRNETAKAIIKLALDDPQTAAGVTKVNITRPVATIKEGEDVTTVWRPTHQDIPGTVSFFEDGTRQVYNVPDWMDRELQYVLDVTRNPISSFAGSLNGISRAAFTTFSPTFVVSNMLNDTLTAFVTRGIMPHQTATTLIRSLRGLQNDKIMQSFRLAGGHQQRFFGKNVQSLEDFIPTTGGRVLNSVGDWRSFLRTTRDIIPSAGELGEQSPRMAFFRREISRELPNWKSMTAEEIARTPQAHVAAADAVELTINFARGGYIIKHANPFVIFLNAAMEGTKLPFRAMAHNRNAQFRMAGVAAGWTSLMAYNLSYPEFHDIPNEIRWGAVNLMLPSKEKDLRGNPKANYVSIIPRTREWAMFLAPITYAMERLLADNPTEFRTFAKTLVPLLSPINEIPSPVLLQTGFEQLVNYDVFRSRPIVPTELQGLPTEEQVTPWTSRTMQEVGETVGVAPVRIQHAFGALLGGAGQTATSITDYMLNHLMPPEKNPRIQTMVDEYEALETPIARDEYFFALQSQDREDFRLALKQPKPVTPVVGAIGRRLLPRRGGQIRETAGEIAARETGISTSQTRDAGRLIRELGDLHHTSQQNDDTQLDSGAISHGTWRERRSARSERYRGALEAFGIQFPQAAQLFADPKVGDRYYALVAKTAAGMPDRRTRAEILAAGWYSIVLEERADGEKEFAKFFDARDAYEASLSSEDRQLLTSKIESRQTTPEREFLRDSRVMRPYFDLTRSVMEAWGAIELYARYLALAPKRQVSFLGTEGNEALGDALALLRGREEEGTWTDTTTGKTVGSRLGFRRENPEVETLLLKWDHISRPLNEEQAEALDIENIRLREEGRFAVGAER
jgi:hypothetical protein